MEARKTSDSRNTLPRDGFGQQAFQLGRRQGVVNAIAAHTATPMHRKPLEHHGIAQVEVHVGAHGRQQDDRDDAQRATSAKLRARHGVFHDGLERLLLAARRSRRRWHSATTAPHRTSNTLGPARRRLSTSWWWWCRPPRCPSRPHCDGGHDGGQKTNVDAFAIEHGRHGAADHGRRDVVEKAESTKTSTSITKPPFQSSGRVARQQRGNAGFLQNGRTAAQNPAAAPTG